MQISIDPGDVHLIGYIYFDSVLTITLRSSAYICMRTTSAIRYTCEINGVDVLNYLELAGYADSSSSLSAYYYLGNLLNKCGMKES